ncbi:MAG: uroporphyrinogen-III C-methyltransferase [Candidatus Omnitrophica bacterium]|nr:uroporphyrinogen-III C-methyltransferase [Candidatus Omnitrophota bacterium]
MKRSRTGSNSARKTKPSERKSGKVYLVGAGPGDPDLITVKGLRILKAADTVLYDDLVPVQLLKETKAGAELIPVGKKPGVHSCPQEEINELIFKKAVPGKLVVRLKGGDPYVLGRGGEEAIYLQERGIRAETVPGISSAVAVPAYAGIPVTHRGVAASFAVVAGHGKKGEFELQVPDADTLVYLMCVSNLEEIIARIQDRETSEDIPCAVIENGTTKRERIIAGTLKNIVARAKRAGLKPPAVLIVGQVVKLRDRIKAAVNQVRNNKRMPEIKPGRAECSDCLRMLKAT